MVENGRRRIPCHDWLIKDRIQGHVTVVAGRSVEHTPHLATGIKAKIPINDLVLVGLAACGVDIIGTATYDSVTVASGNRTLFPLHVDSRVKITVVWADLKPR